MNNRYHERPWQISIHCYREVLWMCVRSNHNSIHFFPSFHKPRVCNYSMCQHALASCECLCARSQFACCVHVSSLCTESVLEYFNPRTTSAYGVSPPTPTDSFITAHTACWPKQDHPRSVPHRGLEPLRVWRYSDGFALHCSWMEKVEVV